MPTPTQARRPLASSTESQQAKLLRTGKATMDHAFFWHLPHYTKQGSRPAGAMRDGRWKLVEHCDTGQVELFDLDTDVGERVDRSNTDATRTASLRQQLRDWRIAVAPRRHTGSDTALLNQLYVEFDPTRFDPLGADSGAWRAVAVWREQ